MRYVILRDDDTNALTPVDCLETLYRPFLACGLPVNLSVIPEVRLDARRPDGQGEGFLLGTTGARGATMPVSENKKLVAYLHANPGYQIVQHGCHHDCCEFDVRNRAEIVRRLEHGSKRLSEAGFRRSQAFVAPHDKLSPVAMEEVARRFGVISTGWFEWRRLPPAWWPRYALKKISRRPHWRIGRTLLLSHPGCLLSYQRPLETMLDSIKEVIDQQRLTVLVTHWWEYFRNGKPDEAFIKTLHHLAGYLATRRDLCVITFDDLAAMPAMMKDRLGRRFSFERPGAIPEKPSILPGWKLRQPHRAEKTSSYKMQ
jgi:hypothetical protein